MDDQQLIECLHKAGMACFAKYYEHAEDPELSQRIEEAEPYTRNSCRTRTSRIRRIIRHGRGKDALAIIANSRNVEPEERKKAAALLDQA